MSWFSNTSIKGKLLLVILLISGVTVLLACAAFTTYEFVMFRNSTTRELTAHAQIIAANSTAQLAFERQDEAAETLSALQAEPHIVAAGLYDKTGQLFAQYIRPNATITLPPQPGPEGDLFSLHRLVVVRPITLNGRWIGTIYLQSDLEQLYSRLRLYGMIIVLVLGGSLLVTLLLATWMQRIIVRPILALAAATQTVAEQKDYSTRVEKFSDDELGQLTDAFNEMLARIAHATAELRFDEARLEALVQINQMADVPQVELLNFTLEAGVRLTKSRIGYIAFANEDETVLALQSWAPTAMDAGAIHDQTMSFPIETTGHWGDTVRQRQPIIANDTTALRLQKKDYPTSHDQLRRYLHIPLFDGERIVAVAGVANKPEPYDDSDVRQLTLLMQGMWRLIHRRRVQEALQQAHDELEERVEQRTAELAHTNEALQAEIVERQRAEEAVKLKAEELARSNAELEQFAYIASHDLQEPLRMVTSYLQLIESRYKDKLDKAATEFIGFAVDGAMRMRNLIKDLLEYSRVGRKANPFAPVDCWGALQTALANLKTTIAEQQARVTNGPLPILPGDEQQLTQLFQNLIGNAIKFHGDRPPEVHVEAIRKEHEWVFTVRDNGIGIDPQYTERIFIIFQRLHSRDKYPGTGIGLAICKKIVERHGGRIWVNSQAGKGATFYFTLPTTAKEVENPPA